MQMSNFSTTSNKNCFRPKYKDHKKMTQAIEFLKELLAQVPIRNIYVSFNGGKDATVVLFALYFALKECDLITQNIKCIYFKEPNPFQEVNKFMQSIKASIIMLKLEIYQLNSKNYKKELTAFVKNHPVTHIIMGTRKDDPQCENLGKYQQSSIEKGYPQFMRVNPIIQWDTKDVWDAIIGLCIPYCKLYDEGYTSLGNKGNTTKNQTLFDSHSKNFKKAFQADPITERKFRIILEDPTKNKHSEKTDSESKQNKSSQERNNLVVDC